MSSEPLDQMIAAEERSHLTSAISRLPETERLVLRMVDVEGFGTEETAGCLAMRHAQVRKALERARKMLASRLSVQ